MKFLATLMVFVGYMLVYAATAGNPPGRFATNPLAGLLMDAYTTSGTAGGAVAPQTTGSATPNAKTPSVSGGSPSKGTTKTPYPSNMQPGGATASPGVVGGVLSYLGKLGKYATSPSLNLPPAP